MRYLEKFIENDLKLKMVFVSGPRQVGKTTLAQSILNTHKGLYLNYDILKNRKIILEESWDKTEKIVVLDEIHKNKKWKNFLKGIYDEYGKKQSFLITGSARLDHFRKSGDALTGRYFHYHLHPISITEGLKLNENLNRDSIDDHLLKHGGFPESFFNPKLSGKLSNNRIEQLLNEDVRDLSRVGDIKALELLIDLLRENNGGSINYDNLAKKVGTSPPTLKKWVELLEKLYLIFLVTPFSTDSSKSYRKEARFYFYDCSLNLNEKSFGIENLVALELLKFCDFQNDVHGRKLKLHYYRDSNKNEVDFVVTENRKPIELIEVKTADNAFSKSLLNLKERFPHARATQLVKELRSVRETDHARMENMTSWIIKNLECR